MPRAHSATISLHFALIGALSGCDIPICDEPAGNLPDPSAAACALPQEPEAVPNVTNAHAWYLEDGALVVTLDDVGLACNETAIDVVHPDDCQRTAFAYSLELPAKLLEAHEITLEDHPEVVGEGYASEPSGAGWTGAELPGNAPFWAGQLQILSRDPSCVSLRLTGVHSPVLDAFSGPVLDGAVVVPICGG